MSKMSDGGKGSKPRPLSISDIDYANRWDAIFSRDLKEDSTTTAPKTTEGEKALQKLHDENEKLGLYNNPVQ
jgi:hypothetical protein